MSFDALVRFNFGGQVKYGNLVATSETGFKVAELEGSLEEGFAPSGGEVTTVTKV